jgi:hypothetical protein
VSEGLSATEIGQEIVQHARAHADAPAGRWISVAEAIVLSIVTLVAGWSGYAAARWSTESRLEAQEATAERASANRDYQQALTFRAMDVSMFNAWFTAYLSNNFDGAFVAYRRFRPVYQNAFDAWLETRPFTNPYAPPGPSDMPQYKPTGETESKIHDARAHVADHESVHAGEVGDDYIRTTVILASVLFLVGISTQFSMRRIRLGLLTLGGVLLAVATIAILQLPPPP